MSRFASSSASTLTSAWTVFMPGSMPIFGNCVYQTTRPSVFPHPRMSSNAHMFRGNISSTTAESAPITSPMMGDVAARSTSAEIGAGRRIRTNMPRLLLHPWLSCISSALREGQGRRQFFMSSTSNRRINPREAREPRETLCLTATRCHNSSRWMQGNARRRSTCRCSRIV